MRQQKILFHNKKNIRVVFFNDPIILIIQVNFEVTFNKGSLSVSGLYVFGTDFYVSLYVSIHFFCYNLYFKLQSTFM